MYFLFTFAPLNKNKLFEWKLAEKKCFKYLKDKFLRKSIAFFSRKQYAEEIKIELHKNNYCSLSSL